MQSPQVAERESGFRSPRRCRCPPTSVEDPVAPEVEDVPGGPPLLQARGELRGRDVQVDRQQRDAQQANMKPPLPHAELSGGAVSCPPARRPSTKEESGAYICAHPSYSRLRVRDSAKWFIWEERAVESQVSNTSYNYFFSI